MVFSRLRKQTGFVVLSPSRSAAVDHFRKVQVDNRRHDDLCAEMQRARRLQMRFGEVGGWAVAEEHRWTLEPLRIILAAYGLGQLLGGCAGVATATMRHKSASILRRIGLNSLRWDGAELPPYYD